MKPSWLEYVFLLLALSTSACSGCFHLTPVLPVAPIAELVATTSTIPSSNGQGVPIPSTALPIASVTVSSTSAVSSSSAIYTAAAFSYFVPGPTSTPIEPQGVWV